MVHIFTCTASPLFSDEIAAEQGSASADVVLQNYLSDSRARKLWLEYMHEQLAAAFEPTDE